MSELKTHLEPLTAYASQNIATELNTFPRGPITREDVEPYCKFYTGLLVADVDQEVFTAAAEQLRQVEPTVRFHLLENMLRQCSDETLRTHQQKILQLTGEPDANDDATEIILSIEAAYKRLAVYDKLQRAGLISNFSFDQEWLLQQILEPDNNFVVSLDQLLSLEASYDPAKKTKDELIAEFNSWASDPHYGGKIIENDGLSISHRTLALAPTESSPGDPEPSEAEVLTKAENYRKTGAYEILSEYTKDLLIEHPSVGLMLFTSLSDEHGLRGLLLSFEELPRAYGIALAANGRVEEAAELANDDNISLQEYADIHIGIAHTHYKNKQFDKAVAVLDKLRTADPFDEVDKDALQLTMSSSPLGFINEVLAETYTTFGAYTKALEAFQASRQYPLQSQPRMAEIAINRDQAEQYFDALLAFSATEHETIFMISDLTIALLDKLNQNLTLGQQFIDAYPGLAAKIPDFTQRLRIVRTNRPDPTTDKVTSRSITTILTATGEYDAAIYELAQPHVKNTAWAKQVFKGLIVDMALRGEPEKALHTLENFRPHRSPYDFDPDFSTVMMGWALAENDKETFYAYYQDIEPFNQYRAFFRMLQVFGDRALPIDAALVELVSRTAYDQKRVRGLVLPLGRLLLGERADTDPTTHLT